MNIGEMSNTVVGALILLFVIAIISMIGFFLVGGYLYPIIDGMKSNSTEPNKIGNAQYESMENRLIQGNFWFFMIVIAGIFMFVAYKLLYQEEGVSVQGYGGG